MAYHVSTEGHRDHRVPRGVLAGAAALVVFSLVATAAARLGGLRAVEPAPSAVMQSRLLTFEDRDDGAIVVRQAGNAAVADVVAPGTNGFVRGTLRGLARERRQHDVGAGPPFRLTRWADGRLSLEDTATGRRIGLEAFGPTNLLAFARFLNGEDAGK